MKKAIIAGLLLVGFAAAVSIPAFKVAISQADAQAGERGGND